MSDHPVPELPTARLVALSTPDDGPGTVTVIVCPLCATLVAVAGGGFQQHGRWHASTAGSAR